MDCNKTALYTVKQARLLAGKTQTDIAQSLNICRESYIKLENKPERFTVLQAQTFSKVVGINSDQIIFLN